MTVIIYGPQGCGKTSHAKALAAHFGCSHIVEDWSGHEPVPEGALVLCNLPASVLPRHPQVMDFDSAMRAAGLRPHTKPLLDRCYSGDDYSRVGCVAKIDVFKGEYRLSIEAPNGAPMEVYARVRSPRAIARMLEEWCAGFVPRVQSRLD